MSSYLVDNETINRIISGIVDSEAKTFFGVCEEELGREMLRLNFQALNRRYGDKPDEKLISDFKFQKVTVSEIQAFKSLKCFLYQCSEGDVPETELFKRLYDLKISWACEIIEKLPEYEKAIWG